ncbi:MAG TPA: YezD family protein [Thermoanaerobaculia bacterium]|nr:YezD family protein [Thermoanaerobaculia bacterium]
MRRAEREILHALREIRYGSLEITIHDSRVVQIERREKVRLER